MFVRDFQHPSALAAEESLSIVIFVTPALSGLATKLSNSNRKADDLIQVEAVNSWESCWQVLIAKKPRVLALPLQTLQGSAFEIYQRIGDRITVREKEVLALCILGLTNRQIGERLYISSGTVKTHIDNLFAKIDCSNRTALAVRSLQLGLVDWPEAVGNL